MNILLELLNFKDFDEKLLNAKLKNYTFSIKIITFLFIYFIIKFNIKYHYQKYNLLMISTLILVLLSFPIVKKITKNSFLAIYIFYIFFVFNAGMLIYLTGGYKAPGSMWLAILPFVGASFMGRRGFLIGAILVFLTYIGYLFLDSHGFTLYPYDNLEAFQKEFRTNLYLFSLFALSMTYSHVTSENEYQNKISREKEKNENLLRILFHDLSNPMQTTRMLIKKIITNRNPEEHDKIILQLDSTSKRITELLDQVRKMKAIEDEKVSLEMKPHIIRDEVLNIIEIFEAKLKEKEITIKIINPESDLSVVLVDKIYFSQQVLGNIISNAIKFSEKGKNIYFSWEKIGNCISIKIRDEGIGIPKEILDNLFMDSKQNSRKGTYGEIGTGYGMPIVKTFIEQFHGSIEISSIEKSSGNSNHGTEITLKLPAV